MTGADDPTLAARLELAGTAFAEDEELLVAAATAIRFLRRRIAVLEADCATLRGVTARQMKLITRLAEAACRARRGGTP